MQTRRTQIKKRRNRLMLALVGCIVLVVFMSLIVMMTSPTGFEIAQTQIFQPTQKFDALRETQAQQGTPTSTSEVDARILTQIAWATENFGTSEARGKQFDAIRETQAAQGIPTSTNVSELNAMTMASFDAIQIQRTLDVQMATEGVATLAPSPTFPPTPTHLPLDLLEDKWVSEIESQTGFTHEAIRELISTVFSTYGQDVETANNLLILPNVYAHQFVDGRLVHLSVRVYWRESLYNETLIFEVKDDIPTLLMRDSLPNIIILGLVSGDVFLDFNQNGFVELARYYGAQEDCYNSRFKILEFTDEGVRDVSPTEEEQQVGFHVKYNWKSFELGQITEFEAVPEKDRDTPAFCQTTDETVTYRWNGERYAKVNE